ncbi:hypothetical protein F4774DRAFT_374713 [Daldinia eschscholtzii]|nr:hypothetical protein F4774DRAFT_374713 [Daldinia eschscholtzii]
MDDLSPEELEALLNGPALAPPAGVIPQFDNPPKFWTASVALPTFCFVLSTALVSMRLYTKSRIIRQVNIADYSILLGWGAYLGDIICVFLAMKYAAGEHQWNVRLKNLGPFLYYFHVASVLYGVCVFFIKFSILMQYIQIFMPVKKPTGLYWATIILILVNFIYYLTGRFIEIFSCEPIAKAWDPLIKGHCINIKALISTSSTINTASDLIILILPQLVIWRLNLSRKEKTGVSIIFLVAIFACACSGLSLFYSIRFHHQSDDTYNIWFISMGDLSEIAAGFAVACLPVARIFLKSLPKVRAVSDITSYMRAKTWSRSSTYQDGSRNELENQENSSLPSQHRDKLWPRAIDVADSQFVREFQTSDIEASIQQVPNESLPSTQFPFDPRNGM